MEEFKCSSITPNNSKQMKLKYFFVQKPVMNPRSKAFFNITLRLSAAYSGVISKQMLLSQDFSDGFQLLAHQSIGNISSNFPG